METNINLSISDLGPINEARLDINQINIVGGPNASGKSFLSKLLFCFLTYLSKKGKEIENSGLYTAFDIFMKRWIDNFQFSSSNLVEYNQEELKDKLNNLMSKWQAGNVTYEYLSKFYGDFDDILQEYDVLNDELCKNEWEGIKESISLHQNNFGYVGRVLNYLLLVEFGRSQIPLFKNAEITFEDRCGDLFEFLVRFYEDSFNIKFKEHLEINNIDSGKIFYIDSLSLLDFNIDSEKINVTGNFDSFHTFSLLSYLKENRNSISSNLEEVYTDYIKSFENELIGMMNGYFEFENNQSKFVFKSENMVLDMKNVASGYKQLGVLQLLLSNKSISEKNWVIIDEPEINLHPGLQIKFAEMLIKLSKELKLNLYINSHSPFIIEAFEVYSQKYNMQNKTSFFLCEKQDEKSDDFSKFNISPVDINELQKIYDNLADPYEILNSIRFENKWKEDFD